MAVKSDRLATALVLYALIEGQRYAKSIDVDLDGIAYVKRLREGNCQLFVDTLQAGGMAKDNDETFWPSVAETYLRDAVHRIVDELAAAALGAHSGVGEGVGNLHGNTGPFKDGQV